MKRNRLNSIGEPLSPGLTVEGYVQGSISRLHLDFGESPLGHGGSPTLPVIPEVDDCLPKIIIVSTKDGFKGLDNNVDRFQESQLRMAHAKEVKQHVNELQKEVGNQIYLDWVQRTSGVVDKQNVTETMVAHAQAA